MTLKDQIYSMLSGVACVIIFLGFINMRTNQIDINRDLVHKKTDTTTITWVTDQAEIDKAFAEFGETQGKELLGLAAYNITSKSCTVYAPLPKGEHDTKAFEILGHEVLHCFAGQFHD